MSDHYKIAVLGDQDSVLGFKALGLDVFPAETVEEGRETLHRLARESYAIVYLTEQLAQGLAPDDCPLQGRPDPCHHPDPRQERQPGHRHGQREEIRGARGGRRHFIGSAA